MDQVAVIRPVDAPDFAPWLDDVVAVYAAAMRPPPDQISGRRPIAERHLTYPGFRAYLAQEGDRLVGFCYGFHGETGQWWHDAVFRALAKARGRDEARAWLEDTFEVAELQMRPSHQKRGIGRRLITTLCAERSERTTVLSTLDHASPARRLYRSLGYVDLVTRLRFPGGVDEFAIMGAPLPLPGVDPSR